MIDLKMRLFIALGAVIAFGAFGAIFYALGEKEPGAAFVALAIGAAALLADMQRARVHRAQARKKALVPPEHQP